MRATAFDSRTLDMVRSFTQSEQAADPVALAEPGCIAAGQRLAGPLIESKRHAAHTDCNARPHSIVLRWRCTPRVRAARKPLRNNRHGRRPRALCPEFWIPERQETRTIYNALARDPTGKAAMPVFTRYKEADDVVRQLASLPLLADAKTLMQAGALV